MSKVRGVPFAFGAAEIDFAFGAAFAFPFGIANMP
jgi:hypothetical protein